MKIRSENYARQIQAAESWMRQLREEFALGTVHPDGAGGWYVVTRCEGDEIFCEPCAGPPPLADDRGSAS